MGQGTGQIFPQPGASGAGQGLGLVQGLPEGRGALRQLEGFQPGGAARAVFPHQDKLAQVGDQHQPVTVPIAAHLITGRREAGIIIGGFDFNNAPLGNLIRPGPAFLHLPGAVQPEIRMAGALIRQFLHTEHLGLERCPHSIEEIGQGAVAGAFARGAAGGVHPGQGSAVVLHCCCQCLSWSRHAVCCAPQAILQDSLPVGPENEPEWSMVPR